MDTSNNQNQDPASGNTDNKTKTNLYQAIGVIVLLAVLFGLIMLGRNANRLTDEEQSAGLTVEKKAVVNDQVEKFRSELSALSEDASNDTRYSLTLRLARAQYQLGGYSEAIETLNRIPESDRDYSGVWYTYAQIYQKLDNGEQAIRHAKMAVESQSTNPQPWLLYAELARSQGLSEADVNNLYIEALEKTEADVEVVVSYARFLGEAGNKETAIVQWQKAGEINPEKKAEYDAEIKRLQK